MSLRDSERKASLLRKIRITVIVHGIAAAIYALILSNPSWLAAVQRQSGSRYGGSSSIGAMLLFLPSFIITQCWLREDLSHNRDMRAPRLRDMPLAALLYIGQMAITLVYLQVLDALLR